MVIAPARLVEWPLRCGPVPPLADCHSTRPETGLGRIGKLDPGDTLILVPAPGAVPPGPDDSASGNSAYLSASGGTGKTQLAAALAHQLWDSRAVDLLTWVKASNRNAILTGTPTLAELGRRPGDDPLGRARASWPGYQDRAPVGRSSMICRPGRPGGSGYWERRPGRGHGPRDGTRLRQTGGSPHPRVQHLGSLAY